jgi:uncharacterized SAM-binding protein YcdF (DUF218 family)
MCEALRMPTNPYALLLAGLTIALVVNWLRRRRSKQSIAASASFLATIWIASTPLLSHCLLAPLERPFVTLQNWPSECSTLVVLGGALHRIPNERPVARLGESSLHRCIEAARLYHKYGQPLIVVSGGKSPDDLVSPTVAEAMKEFLLELGVSESNLIVENKSGTTHENSKETFQLLNDCGIKSIVLVTDAAHMPRALACFKALGVRVTPACCHFQAIDLPSAPLCFVPTSTGLIRTQYALHEWIGGVWYWLTGRTRNDLGAS